MKQRLLLGEDGLEPPPEPREEAPKLLLPYPLGEAVQGLEGGAGPVREELPAKPHGVAVSGPQIGPQEEGQMEVPAVDPGVAPPACGPRPW